MNWIEILTKAFWCGCGAVGFGILFNVPRRTIAMIWIGGAMGGFIKFSLLGAELGLIFSHLMAASVIGFASLPMAHFRHATPMIFSIPSVIPLVPGVFAYRTMLGLMKLADTIDDTYLLAVSQTLNFGSKTLFIIMALALGVSIPMYLLRQESVKNIRVFRKNESLSKRRI
jgi:uncharacterized membrane protein YjjB (DUF3815 family)